MIREEWVKLLKLEEIRPGRAKLISVQGRRLAVFRLEGSDRFVVTDDACPHGGASLAAGEIQGDTVVCPWHAWAFDLETGRCPSAEHAWLRRYETCQKEGFLWVKLPPPRKISDDLSLML